MFGYSVGTVLYSSPGHTVLKGNVTQELFKMQYLIKGLSKRHLLIDNVLQKSPRLTKKNSSTEKCLSKEKTDLTRFSPAFHVPSYPKDKSVIAARRLHFGINKVLQGPVIRRAHSVSHTIKSEEW